MAADVSVQLMVMMGWPFEHEVVRAEDPQAGVKMAAPVASVQREGDLRALAVEWLENAKTPPATEKAAAMMSSEINRERGIDSIIPGNETSTIKNAHMAEIYPYPPFLFCIELHRRQCAVQQSKFY
ncbi:MAG: hypothetical protein HY220_02665 [Candidatus Sungbacteria bacterium]|uniref:Uncharacterized protein n=1 Tax=Candidatus Sungiibacteriota bacterium TaxID=2750080 RepID=A0A9D6QU57_9BACT|nr:hypothetical protein [Candidatus Sungbacteria bacterium]